MKQRSWTFHNEHLVFAVCNSIQLREREGILRPKPGDRGQRGSLDVKHNLSPSSDDDYKVPMSEDNLFNR